MTPFEASDSLSEQIVQLPDSFWPPDPTLPEPEPVGRSQLRLPDDAFVFCCFNATHKIRPVVFDSWMRLLAAVPNSLLWLRDSGLMINARLQKQARDRGIEPGRLHFAGRMENFARHLGRQAQADLFLDTWPYGAHTTANDALWAGLPLVTLAGRSFVSRVSASFLTNPGLPELIATSPEEYESVALSWRAIRSGWSRIRRQLAQARRTTSLFDLDKFARKHGGGLLRMHEPQSGR